MKTTIVATGVALALATTLLSSPALSKTSGLSLSSETDLTQLPDPCEDGEFRLQDECKAMGQPAPVLDARPDPKRQPYYYQGSSKNRHRGPLYGEPRR